MNWWLGLSHLWLASVVKCDPSSTSHTAAWCVWRNGSWVPVVRGDYHTVVVKHGKLTMKSLWGMFILCLCDISMYCKWVMDVMVTVLPWYIWYKVSLTTVVTCARVGSRSGMIRLTCPCAVCIYISFDDNLHNGCSIWLCELFLFPTFYTSTVFVISLQYLFLFTWNWKHNILLEKLNFASFDPWWGKRTARSCDTMCKCHHVEQVCA